MEVGFNFDIRGDILPATKMYHSRYVFPYCIGNGNYGVVIKRKKKRKFSCNKEHMLSRCMDYNTRFLSCCIWVEKMNIIWHVITFLIESLTIVICLLWQILMLLLQLIKM